MIENNKISQRNENLINIPTNLLFNYKGIDKKLIFIEKITIDTIKVIKKIKRVNLLIVKDNPNIVIKEKRLEFSTDYNYILEYIDNEDIERLIDRQGKIIKKITFGLEEVKNVYTLTPKTIKIIIESAKLNNILSTKEERGSYLESSFKINARLIMN